jgi:hypothetical protein
MWVQSSFGQEPRCRGIVVLGDGLPILEYRDRDDSMAWRAVRLMLGLAQQQDGGFEHSADGHQPSPMGDWLAFSALRMVIFLLNRTSLVEKWLHRPRYSGLGRINLSEEQRQDGWCVAEDNAGYHYAYYRKGGVRD